ncbi:sigma-54 dependent transcriptional regulator [Thalassotalea sp. PP2-459]|uniref:sigma-54-dependent transcriptional regulator n=1 Tax=Thalassotalea sp. PP2-459 TaxID=1742724 RepID=UPI000945BDA8|nr:sigma-54 dependent transcriptional regulator [Thalassotalea sp. PP2-459]OKY26597.1 sigma-54-dependent Fis family transcriptional regulator [Thalassotalea sp. PP2-459]
MVEILVVDDRADIRLSLVVLLEQHGYSVREADSPQQAQVLLKEHDIALILLDMNFNLDTTSGDEGLQFLNWMQQSNIALPVIAMTAWSNVDLVVQAMRLGATDFIDKPWKNRQLLNAIKQQLSLQILSKENAGFKQQRDDKQQHQYQWQSSCMLQLFDELETVAATNANILLTGENGTGKSDLALWIHNHSEQRDAPMVSVNMGAISTNLFESEMFGHIKGAFTDAKANRLGRFELAENSTLFLDEIANTPIEQQAKILRVLESGEYEVLGSSKTKFAKCRIISATNAEFSVLIQQEKFREDLYYRLNTIELRVPSLKERNIDIVPLSRYYIANFCQKYKKPHCELSTSAENALVGYHWPGNLRELSHLIERAVLLNKTGVIDDTELRLTASAPSIDLPLMTLKEAEISLINKALSQTDGNIPKAAVLIGLTKSSMYRRIEKYGLN